MPACRHVDLYIHIYRVEVSRVLKESPIEVRGHRE
jgi:hypothetical protein